MIHIRGKGKHKVATFDAKHLHSGSSAKYVGSAMMGTGAAMTASGVEAPIGVELTIAGGLTTAVDSIGELFDWW